MIEIKTILCPVDFSEMSARTLRFAADTARWYGSQLTVLHVIPLASPANVLPIMLGPAPIADVLDDATRARFSDEAARFVRGVIGGQPSAEVRVVQAPQVHTEIVEQARLLPADLIIIGTHGLSGYQRLFLGSTAEKVLRSAPIPVLVVPPEPSALVAAGAAAFDHILCAIDFSPASMAALTYAVSFAQEADAYLSLLYVQEVMPDPAELWDASGVARTQARAAERASILTRLRSLVPDDVRTYCHVDTTVEEGKPYREILRVAQERESDLIILGSHSHGAVGHLFFGSNAGHVVRGAPCPVLAVPPH
jgi:nucleotide-binding universal stress UspA family protein